MNVPSLFCNEAFVNSSQHKRREREGESTNWEVHLTASSNWLASRVVEWDDVIISGDFRLSKERFASLKAFDRLFHPVVLQTADWRVVTPTPTPDNTLDD